MLYLKHKESLYKGIQYDWLVDSFKVALLTNAHVHSDAHEFFSQISANQPVATGYTAGGILLTGKTMVTLDGVITFDADNVLWNITGQLSALYAVVYKDTGNPATSRLITL